MNYVRNFLRLLIIKLVPVKKNRVVFTSYTGSYNDSSKSVFEFFDEFNNDYDCIWLLNKKSYYENNLKKSYIKDSFKGYYYYGSANFIIDNNYGGKATFLNSKGLIKKIIFQLESFLKYKKKQKIYSFWHGTPIKKMGIDEVGSSIINFNINNFTLILGNDHVSKVMDRLCFGKARIVKIGTPRNDRLFNYEDINILKTKLDLPIDKKIILYAPSFRSGKDGKPDYYNSGIRQMDELNFDKIFNILSEKYGSEWVLVGRFHYHVENSIDWVKLKNRFGDKIINGNKSSEMSDYLITSDILLTDVSSSIIDYMHTSKPSFIYFPDYEKYLLDERGMYFDKEDLPFPFAISESDLIENIKDFENEKYIESITVFKNKIKFYDSNNSSLRSFNFIIEDNNEKR